MIGLSSDTILEVERVDGNCVCRCAARVPYSRNAGRGSRSSSSQTMAVSNHTRDGEQLSPLWGGFVWRRAVGM